MSIPCLNLIGERLNPGFASSKALLDAEDIPGLQKLAQEQARKGAHYLTINVGDKATARPDFLAELIRALQEVVDLPLSFDYPHQSVQELCLKTYDPAKAQGRLPIVNSVSELRWDMIELRKIRPFRLVIMASERLEDGEEIANRTAEEIAQTARRLVTRVLNDGGGFTPDDLLVDVSLFPMASDTEGLTRRALDAIGLIGSDPALRGVHQLVGLSNLGIMLPKLALDGSRLNVKLESAFLTLAMPRGLDTILGTPGREYQFLPDDDFVLRGFREAIELEGFETLLRVRELYQAA
jgi:5-methyltetrahydrofolate--homocysteine methyltransferase